MYKGENFDLEKELTARRKELKLKEMDATELKMRRKDIGSGMSQQLIANNFGVARNTVARWENNRLKIPVWADLALSALEMELVRNRTGYYRDLYTRKSEHFKSKAAGEATSDNE
jgi:DNA-binding transcriptional regulator YiaG